MGKDGVAVSVRNGIGTVEFFHPKKNALPGSLLKDLAAQIDRLGEDPEVRVVVLRSSGDGPFCAGASFDELITIASKEQGREFFMGFARVILAMKSCPKLVAARVHGKAVGGGVGLVAAADYALAVDTASIKLSELALGIGPFVVGPCVERKLGYSAFAALAVDTRWRSATWARDRGLYSQIYNTIEELDGSLDELTSELARNSAPAMRRMKEILWEGTENWDTLLPARAAISGELVVSEFTARAIASFKGRDR